MNREIYSHNKQVYQDHAVIREYVNVDKLFEPERRIIQEFREKMADSCMLDIAIGAGRTTVNFAPLVRRYVGIDYSEEMIAQSCKRFENSEYRDRMSFAVADMCKLDMFDDNSFDFILISYNAISALDHEMRQMTYSELQRVGRPGSHVFFSAHNLQWVPRALLSLSHQISWLHLKHTYWNLQKWVKVLIYNDWRVLRRLSKLPYAIINDGAHDFRLLHYYIRPAEQIRQLSDRFTDIRVFAIDGHELETQQDLVQSTDGFLHYLCTNRKSHQGRKPSR